MGVAAPPHDSADAADGPARGAIDQIEARLREVDHQAKNNLQLIASLLLLQGRRTENLEARAALASALERVNAVAAVHRWLFESHAAAGLELSAFVRELAQDALGALDRDDIQISLAAEPAWVASASAAPLALIINELILNAITHAFPPGNGGQITIVIQNEGDRLKVEVADNGVGMASGQPSGPGMGLQIVDLLSQQLRAEVERPGGPSGVRTILRVPAKPG